MRPSMLMALAGFAIAPACAPLSERLNLTVKPERCVSEATAPVPDTPRVPDGAGFPNPVTPAERAAVAIYGSWLTTFGADDAEKTRRLIAVKKWCDAHDK